MYKMYVCGTHSDFAGFVKSSHPVPHVCHIIGLEEVPPGNCIDDCKNRPPLHEYPQ